MSEKDSKDIKVERNPKINIQQADPSLPPSEGPNLQLQCYW